MFATQHGVKNHTTRMVRAAPAAEPARPGARARDHNSRSGHLPLPEAGATAGPGKSDLPVLRWRAVRGAGGSQPQPESEPEAASVNLMV